MAQPGNVSARTRYPLPTTLGQGWDGAHPQPGIASPFPEYPAGSEEPLRPPVEQPFDPRFWHAHALGHALGLQMALSHPHVRRLLQETLDRMLRASYKPVTLPPWEVKPFKGTDLFSCDSGTVQPHASTFAQIGNPVSVYVPPGSMGVIRGMGFQASNPQDWTNLHFQLQFSTSATVEGRPIFPYLDIHCQVGTILQPYTCSIIVPPETFVNIWARADGGAVIDDVSVLLKGWRWPVENDADLDNAHGNASVA